jgi:hypothetical protein
MKIIKRLDHTAQEMPDNAVIGWDVFRCRDYKEIDRIASQGGEIGDMAAGLYGYTVIAGLNLKVVKTLKRFFIRV